MKKVKITNDQGFRIMDCICPFNTQDKFFTGAIEINRKEAKLYYCNELCPHFEYVESQKYEEKVKGDGKFVVPVDTSTVILTCSGAPVVLGVQKCPTQ